jgi:predicted unusual protein kinase regulating ubiquinone biosynthesis (AarF/ABC1/UbiB family)
MVFLQGLISESGVAVNCFELFDNSIFEKEIGGVLSKISKIQAKSFQISGLVLELFSIQRKYGLYSTPDFTLPILSLLVNQPTKQSEKATPTSL